MKRPLMYLAKASCIAALLLTACISDEVVPVAPSASQADAQTDESGRRRTQSPLMSFTHNGRYYDIDYDTQGNVQFVFVSDWNGVSYHYNAEYEGNRLTASHLIEEGKIMSSNTNFVYDKKGRVIAYDYISYFYPEEYPEGLVTHYTLTYDKKGEYNCDVGWQHVDV